MILSGLLIWSFFFYSMLHGGAKAGYSVAETKLDKHIGKPLYVRGELWPFKTSYNVGDIIFGKQAFSVISDSHPQGIPGKAMYKYDRVNISQTNYSLGFRSKESKQPQDAQGWATYEIYDPTQVFTNLVNDCWDCVIDNNDPKDKNRALNNLMNLGNAERWTAWKAFLTNPAHGGKCYKINEFTELWFARQQAVLDACNSWTWAFTDFNLGIQSRNWAPLNNQITVVDNLINTLNKELATLQTLIPTGSILRPSTSNLIASISTLKNDGTAHSPTFFNDMQDFKSMRSSNTIKEALPAPNPTPKFIIDVHDYNVLDNSYSEFETSFFSLGGNAALNLFGFNMQQDNNNLLLTFSLANKTIHPISPYLLAWSSNKSNTKIGSKTATFYPPASDDSTTAGSIAIIDPPYYYTSYNSSDTEVSNSLTMKNYFNAYALFTESGRFYNNNFWGTMLYPKIMNYNAELYSTLWNGNNTNSMFNLYYANPSCSLLLPQTNIASNLKNRFMPRKAIIDNSKAVWVLGADYKLYSSAAPNHNLMPWRTAAYDIAAGAVNIATLEAFYNINSQKITQIINITTLNAANNIISKQKTPPNFANSASAFDKKNIGAQYDTLFPVPPTFTTSRTTKTYSYDLLLTNTKTPIASDLTALPNNSSEYCLTINLQEYPKLYNSANNIYVSRIALLKDAAASNTDHLIVLTTNGINQANQQPCGGELYVYNNDQFINLPFIDQQGKPLGIIDSFSGYAYCNYGIVARLGATGELYVLTDITTNKWQGTKIIAKSFAISCDTNNTSNTKNSYLACSNNDNILIYSLANLLV